jgi:hypothetical protein
MNQIGNKYEQMNSLVEQLADIKEDIDELEEILLYKHEIKRIIEDKLDELVTYE